MARQDLTAPASPYDGPATRDTGPEAGMKWKAFVEACQAMFTELYASVAGMANAVLGVGNGYKLARESYTVLAADDTANTVDIDTGLTTITSAIVQVIRGGKVATSDAAVSVAGGVVTVANGSTYVLTTGDVLNIIAVGT